jgi:hypothetical protein
MKKLLIALFLLFPALAFGQPAEPGLARTTCHLKLFK